jgi:hypothetical protein
VRSSVAGELTLSKTVLVSLVVVGVLVGHVLKARLPDLELWYVLPLRAIATAKWPDMSED